MFVRCMTALGIFRLGILLLLLLSPVAASAQQGARVALVIGNASYPDAGAPLPHAVTDATSVADTLRRMNFNVEVKTNLSKEDMKRAIDAFTANIKQGGTALFYFSGFGLQAGRQSYLIPVNAQIWTEADVRRDGTSIDALLTEMQRKGAKAKIVLIDAARRNPFERRFRSVAAGLAPLTMPVDTLAIYSGALNKLIDEKSAAGRSLFADELLKGMHTADLTAEEMFNRIRVGVSRASNGGQVPWVASSLIGELKFGEQTAGLPPPVVFNDPAPAPPPAPPPKIPEKRADPPPAPPSPSPKTASLPPQTDECDRLAANPFDPKKTAPGVHFSELNATRAVPACRNAVSSYPDTPRFHYQLGRALQMASNFDEALSEYRRAADLGHLHAMNNIGLMYLNGTGVPKDGSRALEWFNKAADQGDAGGVTYIGYAHFLGQGVSKDYDLAIANYSEAIRRDPGFLLAYLNRGNAYSAKGDYDRAIADYTKTIQIDPDYAYAYAERGAAYRRKGDNDTAIADLSEAIRRNPKIATVYNERGNAYHAKQDMDRALSDYSEAIRLDPKSASAYSNRGNIYRNKRDYNRAYQEYAKAIQIAPKFAMAYFNRANAFMDEKKYNSALEDCEEAIRIDPDYVLSYVARGRTYRALGKVDDAIANYNEAIRRDGKVSVAYSDRGFAYEAKGRKAEAAADYRRAVELDPANTDAKSALERITRPAEPVKITDDLMGPVRSGFGAIAYNPKENRWAEAYGYGSSALAERNAITACGGKDKGCQVAIWYNKYCGAVAVGAYGAWSGGKGPSAKAAGQDAVDRCMKVGTDCKLLRVNCSR